MLRRKTILTRACQVAGDLDAFSKNGTSYEKLIEVHRRVQNLKEKIWKPERKCKAAQIKGDPFAIYTVNKSKKGFELFLVLFCKSGYLSTFSSKTTIIVYKKQDLSFRLQKLQILPTAKMWYDFLATITSQPNDKQEPTENYSKVEVTEGDRRVM